MEDLTIEREIMIDAPIDLVWQNITDPDRMQLWFADRVDLDPRPGGQGTVHFEAEQVEAELVVEEVEPPTRFSFRWCQPAGTRPTPTNSVLVAFELATVDDGRTTVRVTETGLERMPWDKSDKTGFVAEHRRGWTDYLSRLAELVDHTPAS